MAIINTTIKLRNDQVSSFEDANTSLQQGEIAIGFLSNGNAIMRVGNSDDSTWESASKLQLESQVDLTEICLQILAQLSCISNQLQQVISEQSRPIAVYNA